MKTTSLSAVGVGHHKGRGDPFLLEFFENEYCYLWSSEESDRGSVFLHINLQPHEVLSLSSEPLSRSVLPDQ